MPYTIKITRRNLVKRMRGKEWAVIDETGKYGYTPEIEREVTEETDVLVQTVDDMDLPAVIKAVNKL